MEQLQIKKLRTIPGVIKAIKDIDPDTYINYRFVESMVINKEIPHINHGNRVLIYLEDVLEVLGSKMKGSN